MKEEAAERVDIQTYGCMHLFLASTPARHPASLKYVDSESRDAKASQGTAKREEKPRERKQAPIHVHRLG